MKAALPARIDEVVGFLSIFHGYHNQISTLRFNLKASILIKALIALFTTVQQNWLVLYNWQVTSAHLEY